MDIPVELISGTADVVGLFTNQLAQSVLYK
jgi:hypothetical protein